VFPKFITLHSPPSEPLIYSLKLSRKTETTNKSTGTSSNSKLSTLPRTVTTRLLQNKYRVILAVRHLVLIIETTLMGKFM